MKEDFLHYLWKFQKFSTLALLTTDGEAVQVLKVGTHNTASHGPDFFAAQLIINGQRWAGNVEIHIKSSDWYVHNHQNDTNYDSVILHVVWEQDVEVYRGGNLKIPTLELKEYVAAELLDNHKKLFENSKSKWINCENQLSGVSDFVWENWLERLYIERLEDKSKPILYLLESNRNNWEATFFCLVAKAFGGNTNGDAFFEMAQSIPFSVIQKETSVFRLEALFMGQCNMLKPESEDVYEKKLYNEYIYLKKKYKLNNYGKVNVQFFRLRPYNFPTIRLAQLAFLYANKRNLFSMINNTVIIDEMYLALNTQASEYWDTHYTFGRVSVRKVKKTTKPFLSTLFLNSIIPILFLYKKHLGGNQDFSTELISLVNSLDSERNTVVKNYQNLGINVKNGLHSQALLTLKKQYCNVGKCLQCDISNVVFNFNI